MAGTADQGFCLLCRLRWEDTFQTPKWDKKGGVAERVSTDAHSVALPNPSCSFTSVWQSVDPWQRLRHSQDVLEAYGRLLDRYYFGLLHLQQQSTAHSKLTQKLFY